MKKNILNEIDKMKSLFNHKRGVVISEQQRVDNLIKNVLNEASYLPCIQNGEGLCKIKCNIKQAKKGCPKSKEVQEIQHALAKEGMYKGEGGGMSTKCATDVNACDGIFDWRTKEAVEEYQKKYGLTVDGSVGVETITKLFPELKCDCDKESTSTGESDNQNNDGGFNIDDSSCSKIVGCLKKYLYVISAPDYGALMKCLTEAGLDNKETDCPDYLDCKPKTTKMDERCSDPLFKQICPNTKITY